MEEFLETLNRFSFQMDLYEAERQVINITSLYCSIYK